MAIPQASLIRRIERHCSRSAVALTTFGRRAVNDGKLVARLKDGRSITLATLRRIEKALRAGSSNRGARHGSREDAR
jgi:hypothetical protein